MSSDIEDKIFKVPTENLLGNLRRIYGNLTQPRGPLYDLKKIIEQGHYKESDRDYIESILIDALYYIRKLPRDEST